MGLHQNIPFSFLPLGVYPTRGIAIMLVCMYVCMYVCLYVCVSVCVQNNSKSFHPFTTKFCMLLLGSNPVMPIKFGFWGISARC